MNGISRAGDDHCLVLSTGVYNLDAIKKTAYRFADKTSVILQPTGEKAVSVIFNFVGKHSASNPEQVIADFCNELLDQDLREIVKRETTPVRNIILAHAFSRTSLVEQE
jgi:His-Xaa-Ser system protein HxsD